MFKDLFLALVLGALLGLGLTGGFFKLKQRSTIYNLQSPSPTPIITETPTVTPSPKISLSILNPEDNSLFNKSSLTISGTSSPRAIVIINTPVDVYNSKADDQGSFSIVTELEAGLNYIDVTAIDENDNQTNTSFYTTYSTSTPSLFAKDTGTTKDSTELAKERIQKIANPNSVTNQNKAFFGNIKSSDDKQIILDNNNITYYINIDKDTIYVNEKGIKTKFETLKSNQTILSLGKFDTINNNLLAKRIIIIDPKTINQNYQVIIGKIADISKEAGIITIIPSKNKDTQYQIKTDQKDLKIGDKVIASLVPDPKIAKTFTALKIIPVTQ